jgi:hypothetical protein
MKEACPARNEGKRRNEMRTIKKSTVFALTVALLLPGALTASESGDSTKVRKEAIQLTQQIESTGRDIQREADRLATMHNNNQYSNRSHQHALNRIAAHVNERLQPDLSRLAELKAELPQWHQEAIDQMHITATNLAVNTDAAILNRNPDGSQRPAILDPDYQRLIKNVNGRVTALVQLADATSDYGDAQLKGHRAGLAITSHD